MALGNISRISGALLVGDNMQSGWMVIGSASGTITVSTTGLNHVFRTNQFQGGSVDLSTSQQIIMTANFTSTQLSGLPFRQFGVAAGSNGQTWQTENAQTITFDGTQELSLEFSWQVF